MNQDIESVLISEEEIERHVAEIGERISRDYEGKDPIFVGVLKGCFIFMADLMRHVTVNCAMDFMAVSSYKGTTSTGAVKITKDLSEIIEGRHVILVEDILDSGRTLNYVRKMLEKLPDGAPPGLDRRSDADGQTGAPQSGHLRQLLLLRGAGRLCGRLWPRL